MLYNYNAVFIIAYFDLELFWTRYSNKYKKILNISDTNEYYHS